MTRAEDMKNETIPAISLWQPWASLIAVGAKKIETRHWATNYRGPIAIHAAKTTKEMRQCGEESFVEAFQNSHLMNEAALPLNLEDYEITDLPMRDLLAVFPLPLGAIVAVAELSECAPTFMSGGLESLRLTDSISEQEKCFGDYSDGRFGWILKNVRAPETPVPYRGEQGLFRVPKNILPEVSS